MQDRLDEEDSFVDAFSRLSVSTAMSQGTSDHETPVRSGLFSFPRRPLLNQREATIFNGQPGEDPKHWLHQYSRVSSFNNWDESMKLANVPFYLAGPAATWFDNHEEEFTSWTIFETLFVNAFSAFDRQRAAEAALARRLQKPKESIRDYFENIIFLCKIVDPVMSAEKKLEYLMNGVRDEFFAACSHAPPQTTEDFFSRCRSLEEQLERRRLSRSKALNYATYCLADDSAIFEDIPGVAQRTAQSEFATTRRNDAVAPPQMLTAADVVNIVRNELSAREAYLPRRPTSPRRQSPPRVTPQRRTDRWRTADSTPLCFHCGRPGHVQRYCRSRREEMAGTSRRPPRYEPSYEPRRVQSPGYYYREEDYPPLSSSDRSRTPSPTPAPMPAAWTPAPRTRSPSPTASGRRRNLPAPRSSRRSQVN